MHRFSSVQEETIKKYSLTLHRLLFGILRQLDSSYSHKYRYPRLHETQNEPLRQLKAALENKQPIPQLMVLFQKACFTLFAHHQHKFETSRDLDQFFSPVICFLVLSSVRNNGGFHYPSNITGVIAHIMFSIRATFFFEIVNKSKSDNIGFSQLVFELKFLLAALLKIVLFSSRAYFSFKEYLTDTQETPMAYYYSALALLRVIRTDETNEARFSCTDERGREFSYQGSLIKVQDITKMINDLCDRYNALTKKYCFFGEPTPKPLLLQIDVSNIVDNLQNTQAGYSFIDDPRNPFQEYRSAYGEWLLSDPERANRFVYHHEERLVWKPRPCLELLNQMHEIREILLLLCIFSAGPSSRASEVARQLLRNVPGSFRNVLILFHVLCLVDIQDKTSHKHLRDKYVPHCPTMTVAILLVYNLAIFRPFEEYLVQILLGDEVGLRYHHQLWPGLKETIGDTRISDGIGRECTRYILTTSISKVSYKILFWRNLVTAILKHQPDVRAFTTHQQYYIDTAMMHSTSMAVARYGGDTSNLPMSDPRQVVECIKVGLAWHKILNIEEKVVINQDLDAELDEIETSTSGILIFNCIICEAFTK